MAARRLSAEKVRLEAIARRSERAVLIPIGAALEARDRIAAALRDRQVLRKDLNRFERRGATALRRNRRTVERQAKEVRSGVENHANDVQSRANDVVERVRNLA